MQTITNNKKEIQDDLEDETDQIQILVKQEHARELSEVPMTDDKPV